MQRLVEAGLCGAGLFSVRTPELVGRYNDALQKLGIAPTKLDSFQIDGIGWSPEVAHEKDDLFYLLAGGANQFGIIMTPDQHKKPIYVPHATYLRRLLRGFFKRFSKEIVDITSTDALTLDIDPEVSRITNPEHLLLIEYVIVHGSAGDLLDAAKDQRELAERIMADGEDWIDQGVRLRLAESGKKYGDLRYRNLAVGEYRFTDMDCFYTEALGGAFVLRSKENPMLVLASDRMAQEYANTEKGIYSLTADAVPPLLIEEGWASVDYAWYAKNPDVLLGIKDCLMASVILETHPDLPVTTMTMAHKKNVVSKLCSERTQVLEEIEWLLKRIEGAKSTKKSEATRMSLELQTVLMRPRGTGEARYETMSLLLSRLRSYDPLELYRADKNRFMSEYRTWSSEKRNWAIARILKHYVPVMSM